MNGDLSSTCVSANAVNSASAATGLSAVTLRTYFFLPAEACSHERSNSVDMEWTGILCFQALPASDFRITY